MNSSVAGSPTDLDSLGVPIMPPLTSSFGGAVTFPPDDFLLTQPLLLPLFAAPEELLLCASFIFANSSGGR